jgi:hypothetical protein
MVEYSAHNGQVVGSNPIEERLLVNYNFCYLRYKKYLANKVCSRFT